MNILENINAAIAAWKNVPPDEVDLAKWGSCGTIHCFGGWLPKFEYFQVLGIRQGLNGAPFLHPDYLEQGDDEFMCAGMHLGAHLFGDHTMFRKRSADDTGTDWEVIERRLQRARELALR